MTRTRWLFAFVLFAVSFAILNLFRTATPDSAWPYTVFYQGDAPVWITAVSAWRHGVPFEWGLPLRPPGMAFVLRFLWNGAPENLPGLRFLWTLFGALVPPLYFAAALPFGFPAAALAGTALAISTSFLLLGNSLNSDIPYLLLVGISLVLFDFLRRNRSWKTVAAWSFVNGTACLFRVEHVLYFGLVTLYLALSGKETRKARALLVAVALPAFLFPLVPWHVSAWKRIHDFNTKRQDLGPDITAFIRDSEERTASIPWTPEARALVEKLPAFGRDMWKAMVQETVRFRGGAPVEAKDVDILRQAFGCGIEPLSEHPFVTLYGPINFHLANNDLAGGGFSREALETRAPLEGGPGRYPAFFSKDFPPEGDLAPWYPPHLNVLNHGYAMGWRWIGSHPSRYLALVTNKLSIFWSGASSGMTGYGIPLGMNSLRRKVDLAVPRPGPIASTWRVLVFLLAMSGVALSWKRPEAAPWLLLLVTYVVVTVLFFGYARLGALVAPAVTLFGSLGLIALWGRVAGPARAITTERALVASIAILTLGVAIETIRHFRAPALYVRGRPVGAGDPYPMTLYIDQDINVHYPD